MGSERPELTRGERHYKQRACWHPANLAERANILCRRLCARLERRDTEQTDS